MNKKIDLKKILKDCPKGFKLYTPLFGEVVFEGISDSEVFPITTTNSRNIPCAFTKEGFYNDAYTDAECLLFPSKDQRDWSKFTATWYKKERKGKFDPNTLKPFDKVLVRDYCTDEWIAQIFTRYFKYRKYPFVDICLNSYTYCIPFNEETKHLIGTTDEAPEYYRYWEE